jgi:hypothetical protein
MKHMKRANKNISMNNYQSICLMVIRFTCYLKTRVPFCGKDNSCNFVSDIFTQSNDFQKMQVKKDYTQCLKWIIINNFKSRRKQICEISYNSEMPTSTLFSINNICWKGDCIVSRKLWDGKKVNSPLMIWKHKTPKGHIYASLGILRSTSFKFKFWHLSRNSTTLSKLDFKTFCSYA